MKNKKSVLHILSNSIFDSYHHYLGSTKDIRCRTQYFNQRKINFKEIILKYRTDEELLKHFVLIDFKKYDIILFEYSRFPRSMHFVHKREPEIKLYTRTHNAEALHRVHQILSRGIVKFSRGIINNFKENAWSFRDGYYRFKDDLATSNLSDNILCISQWDKENYWKYLTDKNKIKFVPFFLPKIYLDAIPKNIKKQNYCVNFLSSAINPFLIDSSINYSTLVGKIGDKIPKWKFMNTGTFSTSLEIMSKRETYTGFLKKPYDLLSQSRAIAVLTDYGTGFKTKILEAIYCKCYILVTKKLIKRLPEEVHPFCIVVDINSSESFLQALNLCMRPFPNSNPNMILQDKAFTEMDRLFL